MSTLLYFNLKKKFGFVNSLNSDINKYKQLKLEEIKKELTNKYKSKSEKLKKKLLSNKFKSKANQLLKEEKELEELKSLSYTLKFNKIEENVILYKDTIKLLSVVSGIISFVVFTLGIVFLFTNADEFIYTLNNELKTNDNAKESPAIIIFKTFIWMLSLILVGISLRINYLNYFLSYENKTTLLQSFIYSSYFYQSFLFECFINLSNPIFYNQIIDLTLLGKRNIYKISGVLLIFSFLKILNILKAFFYLSIFNSKELVRLYSNMSFYPYISFIFKCELKRNPIRTIFVIFLPIVIYFSLSLKILENARVTNLNENMFENITNCFWLVVVSVTTVGYGDIFPETHFGRMITIIVSFLGTFLITLTIVSVSDNIELDKEQSKSMEYINSLHFNDKLKELAACIIIAFYKEKKFREKNDEINEYIFKRARKKASFDFYQIKSNISNNFKINDKENLIRFENDLDNNIQIIKLYLKELKTFENKLNIRLENKKKELKLSYQAVKSSVEFKNLFKEIIVEKLYKIKSNFLNDEKIHHNKFVSDFFMDNTSNKIKPISQDKIPINENENEYIEQLDNEAYETHSKICITSNNEPRLRENFDVVEEFKKMLAKSNNPKYDKYIIMNKLGLRRKSKSKEGYNVFKKDSSISFLESKKK